VELGAIPPEFATYRAPGAPAVYFVPRGEFVAHSRGAGFDVHVRRQPPAVARDGATYTLRIDAAPRGGFEAFWEPSPRWPDASELGGALTMLPLELGPASAPLLGEALRLRAALAPGRGIGRAALASIRDRYPAAWRASVVERGGPPPEGALLYTRPLAGTAVRLSMEALTGAWAVPRGAGVGGGARRAFIDGDTLVGYDARYGADDVAAMDAASYASALGVPDDAPVDRVSFAALQARAARGRPLHAYHTAEGRLGTARRARRRGGARLSFEDASGAPVAFEEARARAGRGEWRGIVPSHRHHARARDALRGLSDDEPLGYAARAPDYARSAMEARRADAAAMGSSASASASAQLSEFSDMVSDWEADADADEAAELAAWGITERDGYGAR